MSSRNSLVVDSYYPLVSFSSLALPLTFLINRAIHPRASCEFFSVRAYVGRTWLSVDAPNFGRSLLAIDNGAWQKLCIPP